MDRFLTVLHLCLKYVLNKQSNESLISHNDNNNGNNKSISQKLSQDSNNNPNNSNNTNNILTFHPNYLAKSCGGLILFAASRLTNSEVGELRLEKSDLCLDFQCILMFPSQLKKNSNTYTETHCNDTDDKRNQQSIFLNHAKIILSSLDYTHSTKLSRLLLTTAVNSGIKVSHNLSFYFLCSSNEKNTMYVSKYRKIFSYNNRKQLKLIKTDLYRSLVDEVELFLLQILVLATA